MEKGYVNLTVDNGIGNIVFFHPASNSMPSGLLKNLSETIQRADSDDRVKVIVIKSVGRTFCAGASFDELISLNDFDTAVSFFMGFARVINTMRKSNKFIIVQVQGKAVGGGVGIIAAADYAMATDLAAVRLSELSIGIGPYVIAPAVKRKIGLAAFSELSINATAWHTAFWAREKGLFAKVLDSQNDLEEAVLLLSEKLVGYDTDAMRLLKRELWSDADDWDELLAKNAEISARLSLGDFTKRVLQKIKK